MCKSKIKVVCSGSYGNCYILDSGDDILVIECGVPFHDILKGMGFDKGLSRVAGCVVSHIHRDHFRGENADKFKKMGVYTYSNEEVAESDENVSIIKTGKVTYIGGFSVQPFNLEHDVQNYGYVIRHENFGKLVFATDMVRMRMRMKNVNHWLIEANYDEGIIMENAMNDIITQSNFKMHMPIHEAVATLRENFCADTQSITLIHMSDSNSDEERFVRTIKDTLCFDNVYAAKAGLEIELPKDDF